MVLTGTDARSGIRGVKGYSFVVLTGTDAQSGIRGVKGYSFVVLTGTDAQIVRPYRVSSRLVASVVSVSC